MQRIRVTSPGGTVVEIDDDMLERYESFGYTLAKDVPEPTVSEVEDNGDI
jgi:hypothetical protein